jgi:hypothetical protein
VILNKRHFALTYEEWIAYVGRRVRRPIPTERGLRRVEPVGYVARPGEFPHNREYGVGWYTLVKLLDPPPGANRGTFTIDWKRELEEIACRNARREYVTSENERAAARSRKFTVGRSERGWLYLMQRVTGGPIKLGFALDVERRRRKIEYQRKLKLLVLDTIQGTLDTERQLHRQLRAYQLPYTASRGLEWFKDVPEVRQVFAGLRPKKARSKRAT